MKKIELKWMIPCMITIPICIIILVVGCNEEQLIQANKVIQDANNIASGAQAVLDSPAGQMVPPNLKLYGLLGIGLINAIVIGWEEWRNSMMKKATKAIVKGIEKTGNPKNETSDVKSNIAEEMRNQGGNKFYAKANKIVDRLKIA